MSQNDSTPCFKKSNPLNKKKLTLPVGKKLTFMEQQTQLRQNKENLFLQIANKQMTHRILSSKSLQKEEKNNLFISIDYEELLQKINELDLENSRLRDLLKSSSYHKITKAEINTTKQSKNKSLLNDATNTSFTEDKFSFSEVKAHNYKSSEKKNDGYQKQEEQLEPIRIQLDDLEEDLLIDEIQLCSSNHEKITSDQQKKNNFARRSNVLVKQIQEDRSHKNLIKQYTQEALKDQQLYETNMKVINKQQDNVLNNSNNLELIQQVQLLTEGKKDECIFRFSSEIFKDLLMEITKKDSIIYQNLDETISKEMEANYIDNTQKQLEHSTILQQLINLIEKFLNHFTGVHPDMPITMRVYFILKQIIKTLNEMKKNFESSKLINEKLKYFLTPINQLSSAFEKTQQTIEEQNEKLLDANKLINQSSYILCKMVEENQILRKINNKLFNLAKNKNFSIESDKIELLKLELEEQIQNDRNSLKRIYWDIEEKKQSHPIEMNNLGKQRKIYQILDGFAFLQQQLISMERRYVNLKSKNNRNKKKFQNILIDIINQQNELLKKEEVIKIFDINSQQYQEEKLTFEELNTMIANNFSEIKLLIDKMQE